MSADFDSFWRKHYDWMSDDQWACFEFLCDLFHGAHHVHGIIRPCGNSGIVINSTCATNKFATFDFSYMTRAVIMAHDRCIRFAIEPSGPNMLKLFVHQRHVREGQMHQRHPTIEQAIQDARK
jgi:hypothetical protein